MQIQSNIHVCQFLGFLDLSMYTMDIGNNITFGDHFSPTLLAFASTYGILIII